MRKNQEVQVELKRRHIDDFVHLLAEHWELSKQIDAGSSNTVLDQILASDDDLLAGKMVCGTGGGGFSIRLALLLMIVFDHGKDSKIFTKIQHTASSAVKYRYMQYLRKIKKNSSRSCCFSVFKIA